MCWLNSLAGEIMYENCISACIKPCWNLSTVVFSHGLHALTQLSHIILPLKPCKILLYRFAGKGCGCFASGEQATCSRTFLLFYKGVGSGRGLGWSPCQQGSQILASINNKSLCTSHFNFTCNKINDSRVCI